MDTHGRQSRGRPRKRWLDNITEDCEDLNLTIHQASHLANERVEWRNTGSNKGLPNRGNIVFVADALSQVSQANS